MKKLISFSGAQSSGKTTLLERCQQEFKDDFVFVPEVTRLVKKKYGAAINEAGNDDTQLCIINQHFENYMTYAAGDKSTIMDRCALDGIVYTLYLNSIGQVSTWVKNYAMQLYLKLCPKVDLIFYTDPSIPLVDDGERSINNEFRDKIIDLFDVYIENAKLMTKVVKLVGTVDERFDIISYTLKNKLK